MKPHLIPHENGEFFMKFHQKEFGIPYNWTFAPVNYSVIPEGNINYFTVSKEEKPIIRMLDDEVRKEVLLNVTSKKNQMSSSVSLLKLINTMSTEIPESKMKGTVRAISNFH